ncbi:hypothetical protein [Dyadobacter sp. CY326]|uniref:hypothetical protein n=1 Tax=Dyadobacter sp. CY326 TaxID=2907300 RepID=UPI001F457A15|nr:hypothetical protein [Dyadobacter sp. CY326]MCE7064995.1 hypothetical protein [Dyadobacter sp. CY326]
MSQLQVNILSYNAISELPDSWLKTDYINLLNTMDYGDVGEIQDAEIKEMCMMSLTDFEPDEAAKLVLDYVIGERLTAGQIENLSHEIQTEKLWEEYPVLELHPDLFRATQLLHDAYNGKFPRTEAVQFTMEIQGDLSVLEQNKEAVIVRILAGGISDRSLINRLFSDQLAGAKFNEAKTILWKLNEVSKSESSVTYDIVSSAYWLDEVKYVDAFEVNVEADLTEDETEE